METTNTPTPTSTATIAVAPTRTYTCHESLSRFFQRVRALFTKQIPAYLDEHISGVLTFVEGIKTAIENPTVDSILVSIAPKIAPVILSAIQDNIDKVIEALEIEIACKNSPSFDDKLKCIADQLATKTPDLQTALLHAMAVMLARLTSQDAVLTQTELSALVAFTENEIAHNSNVPA